MGPYQFTIGLRFELFYALQTLTDGESRIHPRWRTEAWKLLPRPFTDAIESLGGSSTLWAALSDALETQPVDLRFEQLIAEFEKMPLARFQERVLEGMIHSDELVRDTLSRRKSLAQAIAKAPKPKREWLAFVGLYPFDPQAPIARGMDTLIRKPSAFRDALIRALTLFWEHVFRNTWSELEPQFRRSLAEKERLFQSCTLAEFARHALLRIDVDDRAIKALRGGYELPLKEMERCAFIPSAFNDKRYWTAYDSKSGTSAYFPYFDPAISLDPSEAVATAPELDPALIFKALGDTTRFALLSLIARTPRSSVELSRLLSVSKPTISHHVNQLREAGLINEQYLNGSVLLSVRKETIEALSGLTLRRLFETPKE